MADPTDDAIEATAAAVHEAWMATKRAAGVTTRQAEDGEELMVPYEDLSEQAKELDRATVRAVFDAAPTEALWRVVCDRLGVNPMVDHSALLDAIRSDRDDQPGADGTPAWAYDEDGYCVACGNGRWKHHMPACELRDALDGVRFEDIPPPAPDTEGAAP